MPSFETKNFGLIDYDPGSVIEFPCGLPGFEARGRFLALTFPHTEPLVFLQSLEDTGLCFITSPVLSIEDGYRLTLSDEDLEQLRLPADGQPRIGREVACLAILTLHESGPTANLLAPIVINVANLKAVQAIAQAPGYSHQHELALQEAAACS
jgi:flagellar assembly factor FliW